MTDWNGHKENCAFGSFSDQSITIRASRGDVEIPRSAVWKVSAGAGLKRLRNVAIGMGAGAAAGTTIVTKTSAGGHSGSALAAGLFSFISGQLPAQLYPRETPSMKPRSLDYSDIGVRISSLHYCDCGSTAVL